MSSTSFRLRLVPERVTIGCVLRSPTRGCRPHFESSVECDPLRASALSHTASFLCQSLLSGADLLCPKVLSTREASVHLCECLEP